MKKFFLALILLAGVALALAWKAKSFFTDYPESTETSWTVDIAPGSHMGTLKNILEQKGFQIDPLVFKVWRKFLAQNPVLKAGEYEIPTQISAFETLNAILSATPKQYKFTVKEGFSVWDILPILKNLQILESEKSKFEGLLQQNKYLSDINVSPQDNSQTNRFWLEGFLFPETYTYQKYDSAEKIVSMMTDEFSKRVLPLIKDHEWANSAEGRYKILTLASIVEKESGLFQEQPLIASVFWNRINKKMRLQSDPTTIYGLMPQFDGNLKRIHLTTASPYNTYTLPFLPIGPISNPGIKAIEAVLKPESSSYLYFVARGDGTHVFSKDLKTHNSYVREYQILRRQNSTSTANGETKSN